LVKEKLNKIVLGLIQMLVSLLYAMALVVSEHGAFSAQLVSDYICENSKMVNNDEELVNMIIDSNKFLKQHINQNGEGDGHTTLAVVKFWSKKFISIFTVGDSRVYIFDKKIAKHGTRKIIQFFKKL
jgi:serine/threonine protein phosphatase PrpC